MLAREWLISTFDDHHAERFGLGMSSDIQ